MRDVQTGHAELRFLWDAGGEYVLPGGMRVRFDNDAVYSIVEGDPLSANVLVTMAIEFSRAAEGWSTRVEARGEMSCDAGRYIVQSTARGLQDGDVVHERSWRQEFERDLG